MHIKQKILLTITNSNLRHKHINAMIRRTILSLIVTLLCYSANAQVAKWMLKPDYDAISINNVGLLEVRKNNKVGLYDRNGNELLAIEYDSTHSAKDTQCCIKMASSLDSLTRMVRL